MSLRFLPKPKPGESYPLNGGASFEACQNEFMKKVATDMEAPPPKTSPRRPTPFSYAWQFSEDFASRDEGSPFKKRARRRFRGILSLIALREAENLPVQLWTSPPFSEAQQFVPIVCMFRQHRGNAPRGILTDEHTMLYLKLGGEVVAGLSPMTFIFPGASGVSFSPGVMPRWYSESAGDWMDPTTSLPQFEQREEKLGKEDVANWSRLMRPWLVEFRDWIKSQQSSWLGSAQVLFDEVELWIRSLETQEGLSTSLIDASISTPNGARVEGLTDAFPFTRAVGGDGKISGIGTGERLYLSKQLVGDATHVIYRGVKGSSAFGDAWGRAPLFGDHLGEALGLSKDEKDRLDVPFLFVDKLFCEKIASIAGQVGRGFGSGWKVLLADREAYLYPFKAEIFDWFSSEEIEMAVSITLTAGVVNVRFQHGDFDCVRGYIGERIDDIDDSLDFRIFPDYDFSELADLERQLPKSEDRCYHTRVRIGETLDLVTITPLLEEKPGSKSRLALGPEFETFWEGTLNSDGGKRGNGRQLRHRIPIGDKSRLAGFSFGDKGFVLLNLPHPTMMGATSTPRRVGIDFGTSNSCLAVAEGGMEKVFNPHCRAVTLLQGFVPGPRGKSHEGWSALYDFFHVPPGKDDPGNCELYHRSFFPTQLASRRGFEVGMEFGNRVIPEQALICFQSLTDAYVEDAKSVESLVGLSRLDDSEFEPAIILKDRLKWDAGDEQKTLLLQELRRVFHRDLRLRTIHSVAKSGGHVSEIRASFPRAFNEIKREMYEGELKHTWRPDNAGVALPITLYTESHAAAAFLEANQGEDRYLIDVGGGTTDISLFSNRNLSEEGSVRLAADSFDRYVLSKAAMPLRKEIVKFAEQLPALAEGSSGGDLLRNLLKTPFVGNSLVSDHEFEAAGARRAIFYAILTMLREAGDGSEPALVYRQVSEQIQEASIERFLFMVLMFYGGLTYFSGQMHAQHLSKGGQDDNNITISFAGNGSSHIDWLGRVEKNDGLRRFLSEMFRAGAGLSEERLIKVEILPDPKAAVAEGLLRVSDRQGNDQQIGRVYQGLQAEWLEGGVSDYSLRDFYLRNGDLTTGWSLEKSELWKFAGAAQATLKDRRLGSLTLAKGNSPTWAQDQLNSFAGTLPGMVRRRVSECRENFKKQLEAGDQNIPLEPIFISELAALFEALRS